jgi:hypothetical protein
MKVEVTEITLDPNDVYNINSYPNSGLYLVFDGCNSQLMSIQKNNSMCLFIGFDYDVNLIKSEETKEGISQDLFLKTLSLVVNKDESYK